jgi:hypothetical protein
MAFRFWLALLAVSAVRWASAARIAIHAADAASKEPFTFDIVVEVKNKDEVVATMGGFWFGWAMDWVVSDESFMEKLVEKFVTLLPEKLGEKGFTVEVVPKPAHGLVATMAMTVKDFDMPAILTEAKGERFAAAITSLQEIFPALGKEDKWQGIEEKVSSMVKFMLMTKVPAILEEQLAGQHVKAVVTTDPPAKMEEEEVPERLPEPPGRLFYSVAFQDREAIAAQAKNSSGSLAAKAVRRMSSKRFLETVGAKLEEQIPATVEKAVADKGMLGAMAASVTTAPMADAGSDNVDAFWLILSPTVSFDAIKETNANLGGLFDALGVLHEEGLEAMGVQQHNLRVQIEEKIIEGVAGALPGKLEEQLNAKVEPFDEGAFEAVQHMGPAGRCCESGSSAPGSFFWIAAELLKSGKSCPYVGLSLGQSFGPCVYNKFVGPVRGPPEGVVQTHHRAVTECGENSRDVSTVCA